MTGPQPASMASVIAPLAGWLEARIDGASDLQVLDATQPSQGYANLTVCFVARWMQGGAPRERELVARIQRDHPNPLLGDVASQWRVFEAIAAAADVAAPPLFLAEPDPGVLGAPFFLMDRVHGRVTQDYPSYHAAGWFAEELSVEARQRTWWNGVEEMAKLHRIGWGNFPFLAKGARQTPTAGFVLEHFLGGWLRWVGTHPLLPELEAVLHRMIDASPPVSHAGLVWNDARMGNVMFAPDLSVAALFDFEVSSVGPAEIDLAWWLYMEGVFTTQFGVARNAGVPDRQAALAGFERIYGRPMPDFAFYEAVAALKHAVISLVPFNNRNMDAIRPNTGLDYAMGQLDRSLKACGLDTA